MVLRWGAQMRQGLVGSEVDGDVSRTGTCRLQSGPIGSEGDNAEVDRFEWWDLDGGGKDGRRNGITLGTGNCLKCFRWRVLCRVKNASKKRSF